MKVGSLLTLGVILASGIVVAGCGEGPIKTVPVYGTVTFTDREAPQVCDLVFRPVKVDGPSRPSFATRNPDGRYQVKAFQNSRGLIPGKYHVQVAYRDLKPGTDPKMDSSWNITNYDGGEVNVDPSSGGVEFNIEVHKKAKS